MEFKGTKGKWEAIYHSWSDASVYCNDKMICTNNVDSEDYEDSSTEENEFNMQLISKAPEMLQMLQNIVEKIYESDISADDIDVAEIEKLIKSATE